MLTILHFLWDLIVIGNIKEWFRKEEKPFTPDTPNSHYHKFGRWVILQISRVPLYVIEGGNAFQNKITIHRLCSVCGEIEYKFFETPLVDSEERLNEVTNELVNYLNETILYVKPIPVPDPPAPVCEHNWGKWNIVSEWQDDNEGRIIVQRYCTICGKTDEQRFGTDTYDDDRAQVYNDLKMLKNNIISTLLVDGEHITEAEILVEIIGFANGVQFIEVAQADKLARRLADLIKSRK